MALLNPVYGIIVPFLFVVTIPLAILAGITTTVAFSVLMFRVALVYVDIAVNMVPQYVTGRPVYPFFREHTNTNTTSTMPATSSLPPSPVTSGTATASGHSSPTTCRQMKVARHHRRRRTSGASFNSIGSITPTDDHGPGPGSGINGGTSKRSSFMMKPSSIGIDRDFEGVGGWRLNGKDINDNNNDDDAWTHINSRLSLPLDHHWRHHHQSPSGAGTATPGGNNGGGEYLTMRNLSALRSEERSPEHGGRRAGERREKDGVARGSSNGSRVRTPTKVLPPLTMVDGADGYFPRAVSPWPEKRLA